jgi:hypothetical protein
MLIRDQISPLRASSLLRTELLPGDQAGLSPGDGLGHYSAKTAGLYSVPLPGSAATSFT